MPCPHDKIRKTKGCCNLLYNTLKHLRWIHFRGHLLQTPDACVTPGHAVLQVHVTDVHDVRLVRDAGTTGG